MSSDCPSRRINAWELFVSQILIGILSGSSLSWSYFDRYGNLNYTLIKKNLVVESRWSEAENNGKLK